MDYLVREFIDSKNPASLPNILQRLGNSCQTLPESLFRSQNLHDHLGTIYLKSKQQTRLKVLKGWVQSLLYCQKKHFLNSSLSLIGNFIEIWQIIGQPWLQRLTLSIDREFITAMTAKARDDQETCINVLFVLMKYAQNIAKIKRTCAADVLSNTYSLCYQIMCSGLGGNLLKQTLSTFTALIPIIPQDRVIELSDSLQMMNHFFQRNILRYRVLIAVATTISRINKFDLFHAILPKIKHFLAVVRQSCPIGLSYFRQRAKVQKIDHRQVPAFDLLASGLAYLYNSLIGLYQTFRLNSQQLKQLIKEWIFALLDFSNLQTQSVKRPFLLGLHRFVLREDPTSQLFCQLGLPIMKSVICSIPFSQANQEPVPLYDQASQILLILIPAFEDEILSMLNQHLQSLIDGRLQLERLSSLVMAVVVSQDCLSRQKGKYIFVEFCKSLLNLNQNSNNKELVCLSILRLVSHFKHYVVSNSLLIQNLPLVLLRLAPISLNLLLSWYDVLFPPHISHWIYHSQNNNLTPLEQLLFWQSFWRIVKSRPQHQQSMGEEIRELRGRMLWTAELALMKVNGQHSSLQWLEESKRQTGLSYLRM